MSGRGRPPYRARPAGSGRNDNRAKPIPAELARLMRRAPVRPLRLAKPRAAAVHRDILVGAGEGLISVSIVRPSSSPSAPPAPTRPAGSCRYRPSSRTRHRRCRANGRSGPACAQHRAGEPGLGGGQVFGTQSVQDRQRDAQRGQALRLGPVGDEEEIPASGLGQRLGDQPRAEAITVRLDRRAARRRPTQPSSACLPVGNERMRSTRRRRGAGISITLRL